MAKKLTRREFLKTTALVSGSILGATLAVETAVPLVLPEQMIFDENTSIWANEPYPKNPPIANNIEVDVAIIGGGYTGLSTAYYLKKKYPERVVAVFEAREVGHGASGRNGGMLLPQTANEYMQIYSDPQTHQKIYELTVKNMDDLSELVEATGVDIEARRNGVLLVIAKENQVEAYRNYARAAQSLGIPVEFWDRNRTQAEIGTNVYFGSLYDPNAGEVHPMKLVHALKTAAENAGAMIYEDSPVTHLDQNELHVGKSIRVKAKAVVLATNGYTSKLSYFKNDLMPVHTPMAVTAPLADSVFAEIGWLNKAAYSDTYTILYHLSRTSDNRILIGSGYVNYFFNNGIENKDSINKLKTHLTRELVRIYPKLNGIDFETVWTGVLGMSIDFTQSVGVMGINKDIYYGLGYAGHGINLATLFGKIIADLYANDTSKWQGLPFLNHHFMPLPPEPLKWVGVQATRLYYQMSDSSGR